MYPLETINAINNRQTKIRDNFNRDSSFCASRNGFVIHSGIHRSTMFISKDEHADSWFAFQYWSRQGQAPINAFIVAIVDGSDLETAEANAFHAARPQWQVRHVTSGGKLLGGYELTAWTPSGKLTREESACTWRHLHVRTA